MKKKFSSLVFILLLITGCSSESKYNDPPKINLGQDACDNCFMIINEKKFAGTLWLNNGEAKRFDDIGEMIGYINGDSSSIKSAWVYDYNSEKPILTNKAFYIKSINIVSPMGSGIIAFKLKEEAKSLAEKFNDKIISYNQLKTINNQE